MLHTSFYLETTKLPQYSHLYKLLPSTNHYLTWRRAPSTDDWKHKRFSQTQNSHTRKAPPYVRTGVITIYAIGV